MGKNETYKEQEAEDTASVLKKEEKPVQEIIEEDDDEDMSMVIKFKVPYKFEHKEYTEIDLSGLENITATDMIAVNRHMDRTSGGGLNVMPEVSLEYACVLASKATQMPVEFFLGMPPKQAMKVKNRVMGFLFGSE